jgi:hypothetical protein
MQSKAATVAEYLAALPPDRRNALQAVRECIRAHLDGDYEEGMQYGMIGYYVPHRVFAEGYHCDPRQPLPFAALASQKQYMSIYLMGVYWGEGGDDSADARWFREAWLASGKKLDMGKCCVRFKQLEDVALDVIAESIRRVPAGLYVERYRAERARQKQKKTSTKPAKARKRAGGA